MRITIFFISLLIAITAYAEVWTPAGKTDDGTIISYDSSSVQRFGDVVTYWEMSNYSKNVGQGDQIKSKKTQIETNCKTGLDRATKIFAYSKPNTGGDIINTYVNDKAKWTPSPIGSAGEVMLKTVCSLKI